MRALQTVVTIGLALAIGACAGGTRADRDRLNDIAQRLESSPAPIAADHPLTLSELIALSQASARSLDRIEIEGMAARSGLADERAAGLPALSAGFEVGRPDFVRSAASSGLVNLAPAVNWNLLRQFQTGRLRALEVTLDESVAARRALENQAIAAETARLYFQRGIAKARLAAAIEADRLAVRRAALTSPADEAAILPGVTDAVARKSAASREFAYADHALRRACNLAHAQPIDEPEIEGADSTPADLPLNEYVARVLTSHALGKAAATQVAIKDGAVAAAKAERWNRFALRSGLPNVLNILSGSPLALLGYSVNLIDQGAQARRELRAEADALIARIEGAEGLDGLARNAAELWLRRLDATANLEAARQSAARADRTAAVANAQYSALAIDGAELAQVRENQLAAQAELRVRELEALYAAFEYELLLTPSPAERETV